MMIPSALAEAIKQTDADSTIVERADTLTFRSHLATLTLRELWTQLRATPPSYITDIFIQSADSDAPFDPSDEIVSGELFRITLRKATTPGRLHLFFASSLATLLRDVCLSHYILIGEMHEDETFSSQFARYQSWTIEPPVQFAPLEPRQDPRRFVKDFTNQAYVPPDLRPWLLRSLPSHRGGAFMAWQELATPRLMAALSDQVSFSDTGVTFNFTGPPTQAISLSAQDLINLSDGIQTAAKWVFLDGNDADTRHLLFANEWARAYRAQELVRLPERSLESAQAAYNAYVKSGSRETLKALADLRKTVAEETQKISQRAQDLTTGLWKDLPVAAAPFVLKVLPDSAKIQNTIIGASIAFAAAFFLAFSFCMQVYINDRFFKHQDNSRIIWRRVLNAVLSEAELDQFSEKPIIETQRDYRRVRLLVGIIYALLCLALIAVGGVDLTAGKPPSTTESSPPQQPAQLTQAPAPVGSSASSVKRVSPNLPATRVPPDSAK
jgi:hypothetical protein